MKILQDAIIAREFDTDEARSYIVEDILRKLIRAGLNQTAGKEYRLKWECFSGRIEELNANQLRTVLQMEEVAQGEETLWTHCDIDMPPENEQIFGEDVEYLVQSDEDELYIAYFIDGEWRNRFGYEFMDEIIAWRRLPEKYKQE